MEKAATTGSLLAGCAAAGCPANRPRASAIASTRLDKCFKQGSALSLEMAPWPKAAQEAASGASQEGEQITQSRKQGDDGARWQPKMKRYNESGITGNDALRRCEGDHRRHVLSDEPCRSGREHHEADRKQSAEGMECADEVKDKQCQKGRLDETAAPADRRQESRIDRIQDKGAVENGKPGKRDACD